MTVYQKVYLLGCITSLPLGIYVGIIFEKNRQMKREIMEMLIKKRQSQEQYGSDWPRR